MKSHRSAIGSAVGATKTAPKGKPERDYSYAKEVTESDYVTGTPEYIEQFRAKPDPLLQAIQERLRNEGRPTMSDTNTAAAAPSKPVKPAKPTKAQRQASMTKLKKPTAKETAPKKVVEEKPHHPAIKNGLEEFQTRAGSHVEALLAALGGTGKIGKSHSPAVLAMEVYGLRTEEEGKKAAGNLGMVLKGIEKRIKDLKVPYKLEKAEGRWALHKV